MSFWSKMQVEIKDLECFQKSCAAHDIRYEAGNNNGQKVQGLEVVAILHDEAPGNVRYSTTAYLLKGEKGEYTVSMDTHVGYGSIATRLGQEGGELTRDYSVNVIEKGVTRNGGMIQSRETLDDGSVILKVTSMM